MLNLKRASLGATWAGWRSQIETPHTMQVKHMLSSARTFAMRASSLGSLHNL